MGRVIALDVGEATLGVAVSDPLGITAQPVCTIERKGRRKDLDAVSTLLSQYGATSMVVGLPLTLDGEHGPAAAAVDAFLDKLKRAVDIPIITWDERLTTVQAEKALLEGNIRRRRRRSVINQVAAAIILQSYLDSRRESPP